jgi:hypothetical protein
MEYIDIPWEKFEGSEHTTLGINPKIRVVPAASKLLAILKIFDVSLLSASFNGEEVFFEPLVSILLEFSREIKFLGIYESSISKDEFYPDIPSFCMRTCFWSKQVDSDEFSKHQDSQKIIQNYWLKKNHVLSENIFLDWKNCQKLQSTMQKLVNKSRRGLVLEKCHRSNPDINFIRCNILEEDLDYTFAYSLFQNQCTELESLVSIMFEVSESINKKYSFIPDNGLQISYRLSLIDYLNRLK